MRSGHYNHQRHAQQRAQFFALVEADRAASQRECAQDEPDEMTEDEAMRQLPWNEGTER